MIFIWWRWSWSWIVIMFLVITKLDFKISKNIFRRIECWWWWWWALIIIIVIRSWSWIHHHDCYDHDDHIKIFMIMIFSIFRRAKSRSAPAKATTASPGGTLSKAFWLFSAVHPLRSWGDHQLALESALSRCHRGRVHPLRPPGGPLRCLEGVPPKRAKTIAFLTVFQRYTL